MMRSTPNYRICASTQEITEGGFPADAAPDPIPADARGQLVAIWPQVLTGDLTIREEESNPYDSSWPPGLEVNGLTIRPVLVVWEAESIIGPVAHRASGFEIESVVVQSNYPNEPDEAEPVTGAVCPGWFPALATLLRLHAEARINNAVEALALASSTTEEGETGQAADMAGADPTGLEPLEVGPDMDRLRTYIREALSGPPQLARRRLQVAFAPWENVTVEPGRDGRIVLHREDGEDSLTAVLAPGSGTWHIIEPDFEDPNALNHVEELTWIAQ
jgi:hypothetical protein